jgi:hypothetical protein
MNQEQSAASSSHNSSINDLNDLNFDPAAVIDGVEGGGGEGLNLLPENCVDAMELLSYLEPEVSNTMSSGVNSSLSSTSVNSGVNCTSSSVVNDNDILALFET